MARTGQEKAVENGVHRMVDLTVTSPYHRWNCASDSLDERHFDPIIATIFFLYTITDTNTESTDLGLQSGCEWHVKT